MRVLQKGSFTTSEAEKCNLTIGVTISIGRQGISAQDRSRKRTCKVGSQKWLAKGDSQDNLADGSGPGTTSGPRASRNSNWRSASFGQTGFGVGSQSSPRPIRAGEFRSHSAQRTMTTCLQLYYVGSSINIFSYCAREGIRLKLGNAILGAHPIWLNEGLL